MKENNMEILLDDKKLKKTYKKAKLLSTLRVVIIVILVVIPLYAGFNKVNAGVTYKIGTEYYGEVEKILELTAPHTFVSQVNDRIGFLGASGQYTVSKEIRRRPVELYTQNSRYGLYGGMENRILLFQSKSSSRKAGEWPISLNPSGNLKMMAFHPDIKYKEYKNDLDLLHKVSDDSLIEMTLSFDKKYKADEIPAVLPGADIGEILLDGYSEEEMDKYRNEAKDYDGKAAYISESNFIRLGVSSIFQQNLAADLSESYKKFLDNLQYDFKYNSYYKDRFRNIYSILKAKNQLEGENADIIGAVVYGSPKELQQLKSNPHIKASSAGIVTKDIIFK